MTIGIETYTGQGKLYLCGRSWWKDRRRRTPAGARRRRPALRVRGGADSTPDNDVNERWPV